MKFYVKPEFKVSVFDFTDILTDSTNDTGHNFIDDNFN